MFLLALMVMLVEERRETVGILRLIGLRKSRILLQVFAEGLLIAVAGAVFGILFAAALQGAVNAFFQWRYDTALVFVRITPQIALRCVLLAVPLGVLASVISSWTLLRSNVLDLARQMSPFAFALRGLIRQPGRAILGIAGIAATGALLFDMLMLSQGLVVSMERLLAGVGFDIRVSATQATPLTGPPITNMAETVATLAALPGIEDVVPLRIGEAHVDIGRRSAQRHLHGSRCCTAGGRGRSSQGRDIDPRRARRRTIATTDPGQPQPRTAAPARSPAPQLTLRGACTDNSSVPPVVFQVDGIAEFPFDQARQLTAVTNLQNFARTCGDAARRRSRHADDRVATGRLALPLLLKPSGVFVRIWPP